MVAQAIPLVVIASQMGMSVPAVIEYFQGQNIDLSGYGENDLVDLETLFPKSELDRVKEYKTYDESFYKSAPVIGDTSLDNIIVQSKKDDDKKKTITIDQEGKVLPDLPDQMPEPPEDPDWKFKPNWRNIAELAMEKVVDKQIKDLEKNLKLKTKKLGEGYHEAYIDNKTFGISKQGGRQFGGPVFWNLTINDESIDSFNTLADAKKFIEENYSEFEMAEELTEKTTEEYDAEIDEMFRYLKGETVDIEKTQKEKIGDIQRGDPEDAMLAAQDFMGGGVLSNAIEHIGDLTHRITENPSFRYETVLKKVNAMINSLDRGDDMIPFEEEVQRNIVVNSKYRNLSPNEFKVQIDMLLKDYVSEHEKIPTFNDLQEHSKQAAIAIGNQDYEKTLQHLYAIKAELDKGQESFVKKTLEHNVDITTDTGLNFPKEKTDNNTRLHNLRLQNIIDGKAENYPGGPLNDRIVINGPEGSDLPPIAIGNITYKDWEEKITLDKNQILEAANWYKKIFSSFEVMAGDDKNLRDTLVKAWLSGQINETPSSALTNVIYIYEQWKRGVPFDDVKGKGLPDPTNNIKSIIYGKEIEKGIGPKISDFIDAGLNKNSRSWMGDSSSGGQPFVVDVHTARDTGLVDQTYLNHLEKLGYIIPEDIKIDFGKGGITGTKYENRALFGQGLTKYLNETKWMGKSDWKPSEIQAIGWMNLTNMYAEGNQSGDIFKALNRNQRHIAMNVEPSKGSPWQITYSEKYNKLDDDKKFTISEKVTAKAIEIVNKLTGVDFSNNVYGTGGWELTEQAPSTVYQAFISKEAAKEAASMLGYLLNQNEVWVSTSKELTKNPDNFSIDIIEDGTTNLTDSNAVKALFESIMNADTAGLFRGYQPFITMDGNPGIKIIIDKDAIKNSSLKKKDILPYIQEFIDIKLGEETKNLDFAVNTYISEVELEKLVNDWSKIRNGQSFIDNFSKDTRTTAEGEDRPNFYNLAEQLTKFFARLLQEESTTITDATKKITKKKLGGSIEIPKFHFGGFIDRLKV